MKKHETATDRFDALCRESLGECLLGRLEHRKALSLTAAAVILSAKMKYERGGTTRTYAPQRIQQLMRRDHHWTTEGVCALAAAQDRQVDEMLAAAAERLE